MPVRHGRPTSEQALLAAEIGTFAWDPHTGELDWSPLARRILGIENDAPLTEGLIALATWPEDRERLETAATAALDPSGDGRFRAEVRVIRADGDVRWIAGRGRMSFVDEGRGSNLRLVGTIEDVTEQKEEAAALREAVALKDMLLQEVHHRVKNSLQLVSSMLHLQVSAARDPALRRSLIDVQTRIEMVAAIHRRLYTAGDDDTADAGEFLVTVARDTMIALAPDNRLHLELDIQTLVMLDLDQASPLALILSELLSNTVKHAFPDGRSGTIRVTFRRAADGLLLEVTDDGCGLPEGFESTVSSGLGMRIVTALARRLRGRFSADRLPHGTRFRLVVPTGSH